MCQLCCTEQTPTFLEQIIYLDCANCNQIESLPDYLPNLRILSIYNTNITAVPTYDTLEDLYCFGTPISELPHLPRLKKLLAQGSQLRALPADAFDLEMININETNVDTLPTTLISLKWLSAKRTKITEIPSQLISLEWLNIKDSKVGELPAALPSLQYLNCGLTTIKQINISGYKMLLTFYCQGCAINPTQLIDAGVTFIG